MTVIENIKSRFNKLFGAQADFILKANGRANIIGEHTDYHNGWVFPFAIDKGIVFCASKSDHLQIFSEQYQTFLDENHNEVGGWKTYVSNAIKCIEKEYPIKVKLQLVFGGDLPIGAGVSSSSALCCGIIKVIDHLYQLGIEPKEMVNLASRVEHGSGVIGGKMDQFTICFAEKDKALLLDCRDLTFEYVEVPDSWSFILINSGIKHNLAQTAYNDRRKDGEDGLALLQQSLPHLHSLRDLTAEDLNIHKSLLADRMYQRIDHVLQENKRVLSFKHSLHQGDFYECGQLLNASHDSLRDLYEVSCPELDTLQSLAVNSGFIGGSRMMGGGFGGCTINLVQSIDESGLEEIVNQFSKLYGYIPEIYRIHAAAGMTIIDE